MRSIVLVIFQLYHDSLPDQSSTENVVSEDSTSRQERLSRMRDAVSAKLRPSHDWIQAGETMLKGVWDGRTWLRLVDLWKDFESRESGKKVMIFLTFHSAPGQH